MTLSTIGCSATREPEKPLRAPYSTTSGDLTQEKPYWNYEDIGVFFLILVLLGYLLRLFVRFHLLPRSELTDPGFGLQFALVASLSLALYLVLKLRHHRPVLYSLGWFWPRPAYVVAALITGMVLAAGVALYLHFRDQSMPHIGLMELMLLALFLGPILEESFFRGCLLPLLAQTTGNILAVLLTAFLFALFHQPADLEHWVSFAATGIAYGWIRVVSRSTAAAAVMHVTYNLAVFLYATF
ncbi:MAG: CPBP family intramembrane glutamic endopeptidase [Candidatus Korobacteraceae bacterium]